MGLCLCRSSLFFLKHGAVPADYLAVIFFEFVLGFLFFQTDANYGNVSLCVGKKVIAPAAKKKHSRVANLSTL